LAELNGRIDLLVGLVIQTVVSQGGANGGDVADSDSCLLTVTEEPWVRTLASLVEDDPTRGLTEYGARRRVMSSHSAELHAPRPPVQPRLRG